MDEVDKDGGLATAKMDLCCLFGLLGVFDGDDVPRIGLDLLLLWLVLAQQGAHRLLHMVVIILFINQYMV